MKSLQFANGSKKQVQIGRFVCDQYTGQFTEPSLQSMADTGLWFACATGTGLNSAIGYGSGTTPELALADLKKRAEQIRDQIEIVFLSR